MMFNDVHAGLAFAAMGDEDALNRLTNGLSRLANQGHPVAGTVALLLVEGARAFARGDYEGAIRAIEPVADNVVRVGGSNAQREVFQDTLLEAYLRAGHFDEAQMMLRRRMARRASARDLFWLGRAEAGTGQTASALAHLQEARTRWGDADPGSHELGALNEVYGTVSADQHGST